MARAIGVYLSRQPHGNDIVDAHVALLARQHGFAVVTSDADDLLALDPGLAVVSI